MCVFGGSGGRCGEGRRLIVERERRHYPSSTRAPNRCRSNWRSASRKEATLDAVQLRLRPIMMTSFAFILGVAPLVIAVGAGAEMRQTLGTAVFTGMLGVTLFGIFLTPVFYYVIQ
jgi:multidrug efflux pump subunit AcrB